VGTSFKDNNGVYLQWVKNAFYIELKSGRAITTVNVFTDGGYRSYANTVASVILSGGGVTTPSTTSFLYNVV